MHVIRQECRTEIEVSYHTEYDEVCQTVAERQCHPVVKQVPDKECHTTYEKVCITEIQTTYDHSYAEECKPVQRKVLLNNLVRRERQEIINCVTGLR